MRFTRLLENINESIQFPNDELDQKLFLSLMSKNKALLIRSNENENPFTVDDFGNVVANLNLQSYKYVGGAAPRRIIPVNVPGVKDMIYTANEAPPDELIPFHHELAQVQNPPAYLFFYCNQPSETGGETALIDSTLVYRYANDNFPEFIEKLKKYGARYKRTLPVENDTKSPIGRSFYNTYQVSTKEEVEKKLNAVKGLDYEWQADGCLTVVSEPIPAIKMIEEEHDQGVYQWTFHNSVVAAFIGWGDSRNDRKKAVRFGNDDPMDENVLNSIAKFMKDNKVSYKWQKGDFFALNNRLVMHSRNSFTGVRRVYAAMFGDAKLDENVSNLNVSNPNSPTLSKSLVKMANRSNPMVFGLWRLGDPEKCVYEAIKNGYRRLDSACDYGNEKATGRGIRRAIQEGICNREDLYITSKLWNTYHDPNHVPLALERSLEDLGLEYLDEYLIHFPISMEYVPMEKKYPPEWSNLDGEMVIVPNDINRTWKAMEQEVDNGTIRFIGLSNFNCQHIRQVLSIAKIRPRTLQIECHPHLSQCKLIRFAREQGIRVTVFSPMGATSYVSLDMATKDDILFQNSIIQSISRKHNKSPAQIMLRWALQRNTFPISKSSSAKRMKENQNIMDFYLYKKDMESIDSLNLNRRYNDPGKRIVDNI